MGYPKELLDAAITLYRENPETQATLRRSVSTAYYALFHLLIETFCANWPVRQRSKVARQFDHKPMKQISIRTAGIYGRPKSPVEQDLLLVAKTFAELQPKRNDADYDMSTNVSSIEAANTIGSVETAFESWERIKEERIAQDYLFSLLFPKDRV